MTEAECVKRFETVVVAKVVGQATASVGRLIQGLPEAAEARGLADKALGKRASLIWRRACTAVRATLRRHRSRMGTASQRPSRAVSVRGVSPGSC